MTDKLQQALEFGIANNLPWVEVDGIKIPVVKKSEQEDMPAAQQLEDITKLLGSNPFEDLTEEEILFWSTPHFDEIQEAKNLRQAEIEKEIQVKDQTPRAEVKNGN